MELVKTIRTEWCKIPIWAKNAVIILGSSLLLGLSAHIAIPLPFTPVPMVTQPTLILLLAMTLGSKRAASSVLIFLTQGAMGLPVFANGGASLSYMVGPTGGYLFGYLVAAYAVGKIAESFQQRTAGKACLALVVGYVIVYVLGAAWLSAFVGVDKVFWLGVAPFLFGDFLKLLVGVKVLQWTGWLAR